MIELQIEVITSVFYIYIMRLCNTRDIRCLVCRLLLLITKSVPLPAKSIQCSGIEDCRSRVCSCVSIIELRIEIIASVFFFYINIMRLCNNCE